MSDFLIPEGNYRLLDDGFCCQLALNVSKKLNSPVNEWEVEAVLEELIRIGAIATCTEESASTEQWNKVKEYMGVDG